jgi:TrkA domain protein
MADIIETPLPGVGVRHEFTTADKERVAVLTHRSGRREIAIYDRGDPDACRTVLRLSPDDTRALADVLGASSVSETVASVQQDIEGVAIDWVTLPADSPFADSTIANGQFRTRTGASVIAIVRGAQTIPAPGPEQELHGDDVIVAVGTPEGLAHLRNLLVS